MSIETLNNQNEDSIQESLIELKEQIDKPGKFIYKNESKDKKYDIYSYKLVQGGNKGGIKNKYINQIGQRIEGTEFTDVNGNELKKEKFETGETIYLRVPKKKNNKESKDSLPEMSLDEIMKMSDKELSQFLIDGSYEKLYKNTHSDKKGMYKIINGKKLYIGTRILERGISGLNDNTSYIDLDITGDGDTSPESICICRKIGNKLSGIYYEGAKDGKGKPVVYRGDIIQGSTKDTSFGAGRKNWTKSFSSYRNNIHNY